MRLHYLQHVPFEGPAAITAWAESRGHSLACCRLFEGQTAPNIEEVDGLIVMGGPMGVGDIERFPWLKAEADYLKTFIATGKPLLGICLGAQLIAHVLGAAVTKNSEPEIGWFPITSNPQSSYADLFPSPLDVYHWHGDTFAIPNGAEHLASSQACTNQGFIYNKVVGLQFHLEATPAWAERLIEHCSDELIAAPFVQQGPEMLSDLNRFDRVNQVLNNLLDRWSTASSNS